MRPKEVPHRYLDALVAGDVETIRDSSPDNATWTIGGEYTSTRPAVTRAKNKRRCPTAISADYEALEWGNIAIVRLPKGGKVPPPSSLDVTPAANCPPSERRLFQRLHQVVGSLTAMPSVAVGKRVDGHEAVVEPDGDAQRLLVLGPDLGIRHKVSNTDGNPSGIGADRCLEPPIGAGPSPDIAEHRAVEFAQIFVVQERLQRRISPPLTGSQDVFLFGLVQFAAGGDISKLQPLAVIVIEWGVPVTERKK
jgi:hypothetical protein